VVLKERLLVRPSKQEVLELVEEIINNPKMVKELVDCCFIHKKKVDQMAAWTLGHLAQRDGKLIQKYFPRIVTLLEKDIHPGVKRDILRIFEDVPIPKKIEGYLYDKCLGFIINTKLPIAVSAFGITVATKIAMNYPELKEELLYVLQSMEGYGSVAYTYRRGKSMKLLSK